MNDFDIYAIDMDAECVNQDFDDVDLYGEHTLDYLEEENSNSDSDILLQ